MTHKITLIPGDGIGPEVTAATVRILEAAGQTTGCGFEWERHDAGAEAFAKTGEYIPQALYDSITQNKLALKGPVTTPIGQGFSSINVTLRKKFDLYANFRPVKSLPGLKTNYPKIDLVIFRENTEDLYAGLEVMVQPDVAQSLKIITVKGSTRIARAAFEYARKHGRKKVHAIHKANIMKLTDGLFLRCCKAVATEYPEIQYLEHIVDNACMQLVLNLRVLRRNRLAAPQKESVGQLHDVRLVNRVHLLAAVLARILKRRARNPRRALHCNDLQ